MQGRRDLGDVASLIMSELTPVVSAQHGAFFLAEDTAEVPARTYELRLRRQLRLLPAHHARPSSGPARG